MLWYVIFSIKIQEITEQDKDFAISHGLAEKFASAHLATKSLTRHQARVKLN
jgi:hypothetical protein